MPIPIEHIEREPVIHEKVRNEEVEEIQPVIFREHERSEVHEIVQPIETTEVKEAQYFEKQLSPKTLPTITKGVYVPPPHEMNTLEVETQKRLVQMEPIVVDTETKKIIEEVQPVIYKETIVPTVIHETKQIFEKVIEAPVVTKEVRNPIHIHGLPSNPNVNMPQSQ